MESSDSYRQLLAEFAELTRHHFDEVAGELRGEIGGIKRHFDVVAEGLRGEIRLIAEGHMSLQEQAPDPGWRGAS